MALFSERNGYKAALERFVPETMSPELKNLLWNAIDGGVTSENLPEVLRYLWQFFYKRPLDTIPMRSDYMLVSYAPGWKKVRELYFAADWAETYDYVEVFLSGRICREGEVNALLDQEGAAYRVIAGQVVQITDQNEIDEVRQMLEQSGRFVAAGEHFKAALALMSDREQPDFRNSIKESVSAVESVAKVIVNDDKATLGAVLSKLETAGRINPALKKGFSAIYGWTSDAEGIRHAMTAAPKLVHADAKFFLVACSAFANYLKVIGTE